MTNKDGYKKYRKLLSNTLIAVYILIFIGGLVRSTGAGMGCPDWPKCFGQWVPPTSEDDLSPNYREEYAAGRMKKNERIAKSLSKMGFTKFADQIINDPSIYVEEEFNALKTWTEYVNRLAGAVIGFFVFAVLIFSFKYFKSKKLFFVMAIGNFFLTIFQAWLGSIVVSTKLMPWAVTAHMLLAFGMVAFLLVAYYHTFPKRGEIVVLTKGQQLAKALVGFSLVLYILQVVFGTKVRGAVDLVLSSLERNKWARHLGDYFPFHAILAFSLVAFVIIVFGSVQASYNDKEVRNLNKLFLLGYLLEFCFGVMLITLHFPQLIQPLHLTLGTLLFGVQFYLLLLLKRSRLTKFAEL